MNEIKKIAPNLEFRGKILSIFNIKPGKTTFKLARFATSLLFKNKKHKGYIKNDIYIGEKKLRLCVYSKKGCLSKNMPLIIWIHGGGYGMGIPEVDFSFVKEFFAVCDCVVVSPDYTLSYVEPFPRAIEDCYQTLLWAKDNALKLNCDPNTIFVGGDSAGGGLCMALCLMARDKGEVKISFQMPIYPMIEDRYTSTNKNNQAPVWNTKNNESAWKIYLGEQNYQKEGISYYAVPARCEDYCNMPPAISYVGDLDPFLDETKTAFEKLENAGIKNELLIIEGCYHGFDIVCAKSEQAKIARKFLRDGFSKAVKKYARIEE